MQRHAPEHLHETKAEPSEHKEPGTVEAPEDEQPGLQPGTSCLFLLSSAQPWGEVSLLALLHLSLQMQPCHISNL